MNIRWRRSTGGAFGARVYKISRDDQGNRLTHMKITGRHFKSQNAGERWKDRGR